MTTIEKVGSRLYCVGSPFSAKDELKKLGCHWDGDRRQWWIGAAKKADLEALVNGINQPQPQSPNMEVSRASTAAAVRVGLDPTPAGIVADKVEESGDVRAATALRKPKQDPNDIRLTGKGRYKGKEYYAGSMTKDGTRVRLLTLPDANGDYLDFWADCSLVEQTKTYTPREQWDGRRYSNRTVTVYTTLGSIADFVAKQRRAEKAGVPQCPVCGKRNDNMVRDLETGMTCCYGCADMPEAN